MKVKLDENLGRSIQRVFRERRFDAITVREQKLAGAKDPRVMQAASRERRILVTTDQDFANVLLFPPENTAGVAVIRLPGRATRQRLMRLVSAFLDAIESRSIAGKLWIVEPGRIREHQVEPPRQGNK